MEDIWDEPVELEASEELEELDEPSARGTQTGQVAVATVAATVPVSKTEVEVAGDAVFAVAPEPRLIPIRDKHYAFGRAASFAELLAQSPNYSVLLRNRYAETRLAPGQQAMMTAYPDTLHVLAVVTEEDPDTLSVLPVVARLLDACPRFDLRILHDDDSLAAFALLLPDVDVAGMVEEWDLPQFLCFDEEWELVAQWGPRPAAVEDRLEKWLSRHSEYETIADDESIEAQERYAALVNTLIYEMRVWYNSGAARACLEEWHELLQGLLSAEDQAQFENGVA